MQVESGAPRPLERPSRRLAFVMMLAIAHAGGCRRDESSQFLTVFAASSLTESFQDLERAFEADHPGVDVQLAFAGSQTLRVQIEQGARADVFASAAEEHVQALVQAGLIDGAEVFAHNALVVVVPKHGASEIDGLDDLPKAERIVLGTPEVPVGIYARQLIERADAEYGGGFADAVRARVVSEEANVRLVLSKVELGEADAAIVYRTDAVASGKVRAISVPGELDVPTEYAVGVVATTTTPDAARDWLELLESPKGRAALERRGFAIPNAQ